MSSIADISTAIKEQLETIPGLRVFDHPPQGAAPPFAFIRLTGWEPLAMGRAGTKNYRFAVTVLTAQSVRPEDGYDALVEYADTGASSVELAIWDGNAVGGIFGGLTNTQAFVAGFEVLGIQAIDAYEMYGGEFQVEVHTKG